MIIDVDNVDPPPLAGSYDVCIAGAGIAGIVLATRLADLGQRVLLLEAGGLFPTDKSQAVYRGDIVGHDYFDLDLARLRYLGGTSGHWAGWCRPLDPHDFEHRPHIEGSGWPIGVSDIEQYLPAAREILELSDSPPNAPLAGSGGMLTEAFFRYSGQGNPVRFVEKYHDVLAASKLIDVLLNANVVDAVRDTESGRLKHFAFRSYQSEEGDKAQKATATFFVLAMGGIENARTLLNANGQEAAGLGNEHDLVGRYFIEHPVFNVGFYVLERGHQGFGQGTRFVSPSPELMRLKRIGNSGARVHRVGKQSHLLAQAKEELRGVICISDHAADLLRRFRHSFTCGRSRAFTTQDIQFDNAGRLEVATEQMPNRNSRVLLSNDTDRFGLRRSALDWRLTLQEKLNMREIALAIGGYFARERIGRVKVYDWVLTDDEQFPSVDDGEEVAGFHHMGTTRMGASPPDGVVDRDCLLFGVDNLYVAGSSVFRTGGYANPTLTIVQLALRLAEHLGNPSQTAKARR